VVLDALARRPDVDASRVAATGMSMGGSEVTADMWKEAQDWIVQGLAR